MSKPQENNPDNDQADSPSLVEIVMMVGVLGLITVLMLMVIAAM